MKTHTFQPEMTGIAFLTLKLTNVLLAAAAFFSSLFFFFTQNAVVNAL